MKKRYLIPTYLLLYVGIFILSISYFYTTNDDSFITARYAKNLTEGFGLVSNPFGPTQEGYSNLTLVLLEVFLYKFFSIDYLVGAKIIGIFSVFLSCFVSGGILKIFFDAFKSEAKKEHAWLSKKSTFHIVNMMLTASIGASTWYLFWSTQGLETTLQSALLLVTAYFFLYSFVYEKYSFLFAASVTSFLSLNTRPEGVMLFPLILILVAGWFVFTRKVDRKVLKSAAVFTLLSTALVSLLFAWKIMYFGDIVPNPTHVKMAIGVWNRNLNYIGGYFNSKGLIFVLLFSISFAYATWFVLKNACIKKYINTSTKLSIIMLTLLGFISSQMFFIVASGGDYMPYGRFFATHYPFIILLIFTAFTLLPTTTKSHKKYFSILAVVLSIIVYSGQFKEDVVNMRWWDMDFIGVDEVHALHNTVHHRTVNKINDFMSDKGGYFASSEFGYIAYHVDAKGLDIIGLNQKEIARNFKLYGVEEAVYANRDFILSKRPQSILTLNLYRDEEGEIIINPGQAWFLKPYFQSGFFLKYYNVLIPEGKESDEWLLNEWNDTYVPSRSIAWNDITNQEKLLYGFYSAEKDHRWMKPLARVLLRPNEYDNQIVFKGFVPDISLYPHNEVEVEILVNGKATGDLRLTKEVIKQSGNFSVAAPWMFDCPCEDTLITIKSTQMNTNEAEKRQLSVAFTSIAFEEN